MVNFPWEHDRLHSRLFLFFFAYVELPFFFLNKWDPQECGIANHPAFFLGMPSFRNRGGDYGIADLLIRGNPKLGCAAGESLRGAVDLNQEPDGDTCIFK